MKKYKRLTLGKRYQIQALKASGMSMRKIGITLELSASTISRELGRNSKVYQAHLAQNRSIKLRRNIGPERKIRENLKLAIDAKLQLQWSPDQISVSLRKEKFYVSHETIYQYIYREHRINPERKLYENLRRQRRSRTTAKKREAHRRSTLRPQQIGIALRPKIVEKRVRLGDFERDLMLGKNSRLLTIVDRRSRLTKIAKLSRSTATETHKKTIQLLRKFKVRTITNDNGAEFSAHKLTAKKLKAKVFFADAFCSWQRGTNENTNGLIRHYYPKGTDFNQVSDKEIKRIENLLNNRPRKILGYLTPLEVHRKLSQGVALSA